MTNSKKNVDCLLFDCDGTLIDTYDIILETMRYTVNDVMGQDRSDAELMQGVGTPLHDQMRFFLEGDESRVEKMVALYREHNDRIHDEGVSAFDGIKEALTALKDAGYRMGVVTSKRHFLADRGLQLCGLRDYFEVLIGSDDFPIHKPAPGPIIEACERLGVSPENSVYIGDSPYDIQAGNAAGCITIAALWGMFDPAELRAEHPDLEAKNASELPGLINKL